jgi:hypothetical protein
MSFFYSMMFGILLGFMFGVGCALAVLYTIYNNGYKKAVEHSLLAEKPPRFVEALARIEQRPAR